MSYPSLSLRRSRAATPVLPSGHPAGVQRTRIRLADGASTTLHVAWFARSAFSPRVVRIGEPLPLVRWCWREGVRHAVTGGFFDRGDRRPLGELWLGGKSREFVPFNAPWAATRGCLHICGRRVRIAGRDELDPDPLGDLLQAGPVLARDGRVSLAEFDPEGFASDAAQFDFDITDGRHPRAALALTEDRVLAVACDGRERRDAGMTLRELADTLVEMGAVSALNLDGGGSATLVYDGRLRNRPREQHGIDLLEGRAVPTAIVLDPLL